MSVFAPIGALACELLLSPREIYMRRFLGAVVLSGFLLAAPVAMRADDHPKRYYDPYKRDYHEWNEAEEHAYRHWVEEERHLKYHDWEHANKKEQRDYWKWRHEHPDWH